MYNHLIDRRREAVDACVQLLKDHSREMALDPRFFNHIDQAGPGSISSASSSNFSAATGITSPSILSTSASAATLRSTASSPSLRAREGIPVHVVRQDGPGSPSPGGNVRVVVRVRKFLPRGMMTYPTSRSGPEGGYGPQIINWTPRVLTTFRQKYNVMRNVLSPWTRTPR